ncbi:MAG: hypothetical protein ACOZIN_16415 [Myxococcota bacterium]
MSKKIGELLIESGAASEGDVAFALKLQEGGDGRRLGEILVEGGKTTSLAVARALATQHQLPFVQLPAIPPAVAALVPLDYQAENQMVVFRTSNETDGARVHVALADPTRLDILDELRFQLRRMVTAYVAAADDVAGAVAALKAGDGEEIIVGELLADGAPSPVPSPEELWPPPASAKPASAMPVPVVPATLAEGVPEPITAVMPPPSKQAWPVAIEPTPLPSEPGNELREHTAVDIPITTDWNTPAPSPKAAWPVALQPTPAPEVEEAPELPPEPVSVVGPAQPLSSPKEILAAADELEARLIGDKPAAGGNHAKQTVVARAPALEISEADLQILDSLERMARGDAPTLDSEKVRPAQMVASLIRLLIRKGVIQEMEFLDELSRK